MTKWASRPLLPSPERLRSKRMAGRGARFPCDHLFHFHMQSPCRKRRGGALRIWLAVMIDNQASRAVAMVRTTRIECCGTPSPACGGGTFERSSNEGGGILRNSRDAGGAEKGPDLGGNPNQGRKSSAKPRWPLERSIPEFPTKVGGHHMTGSTDPARDSSLKDR
jgi:hypothetical protein